MGYNMEPLFAMQDISVNIGMGGNITVCGGSEAFELKGLYNPAKNELLVDSVRNYGESSGHFNEQLKNRNLIQRIQLQ